MGFPPIRYLPDQPVDIHVYPTVSFSNVRHRYVWRPPRFTCYTFPVIVFAVSTEGGGCGGGGFVVEKMMREEARERRREDLVGTKEDWSGYERREKVKEKFERDFCETKKIIVKLIVSLLEKNSWKFSFCHRSI